MSDCKRSCRYEECSNQGNRGRGLCRQHYNLCRKNGTLTEYPLIYGNHATTEDRFFSRVQVTGFCWEWAGRLNKRGYALFDLPTTGVPSYAHRWVYEHMVRPIPYGMTIDHLCFNTRCVNPDHLEPVTKAENARRRDEQRRIGGRHLGTVKRGPRTSPHKPRTLSQHCRRGHELTPENTYLRPDNGYRQCRACIDLRKQNKRVAA